VLGRGNACVGPRSTAAAPPHTPPHPTPCHTPACPQADQQALSGWPAAACAAVLAALAAAAKAGGAPRPTASLLGPIATAPGCSVSQLAAALAAVSELRLRPEDTHGPGLRGVGGAPALADCVAALLAVRRGRWGPGLPCPGSTGGPAALALRQDRTAATSPRPKPPSITSPSPHTHTLQEFAARV
jgi:hypothetical protein